MDKKEELGLDVTPSYSRPRAQKRSKSGSGSGSGNPLITGLVQLKNVASMRCQQQNHVQTKNAKPAEL